MIENCPHCGVNLIYKKNKFRLYSRVLGVMAPDAFEGVLYWKCPDCQKCWQRWPEGTVAFDLAAKHMSGEALP